MVRFKIDKRMILFIVLSLFLVGYLQFVLGDYGKEKIIKKNVYDKGIAKEDIKDSELIFLKSVDPLKIKKEDVSTIKSVALTIDSIERYYIVQFIGPIKEEWKQELREKGVEFYSYIPHFAFIVKMDENIKNKIKNLDFIRWIGHYQPEYKINPKLRIANETKIIRIKLLDKENKNKIKNKLYSLNGVIQEEAETSLKLSINDNEINKLAAIEGIEWIEEYKQFKLLNDKASAIIETKNIHKNFGLFGNNQIIAIADSGIDTGVNNESMHDDIEGRIKAIFNLYGSSADDKNGHGTHVTGSALGNGNRSGANPTLHNYTDSFAGSAPEARLVFQAIGDDSGSDYIYPPDDLKELFQQAYDEDARIHSNSWGAGLGSEYTTDSANVDEFVFNNKDMVIVLAAGNSGTGLKTIDSPGTAKNAITIGASENSRPEKGTKADNISQIASFSSRGSVQDGRIKPDVVAPGTYIASLRSSLASPNFCSLNQTGLNLTYYTYCSGTSMATPLAAGTVALVREYYIKNLSYYNPSSALIKATIINGAQDIGYGIPSNETGWGRINLSNSIFPKAPKNIFFADGTNDILTEDETSFYIEINDSSLPLRLTLVWTDKESSPSAAINLVNDLDLILVAPNGSFYYGNDFSEPFNDSFDRINNVERVEIQNPSLGIYEIKVRGYNVPEGPQSFAVVASYNGLRSNLPKITAIECEENNSVWQDCSEIQFYDKLTQIRANCSIDSGSISNVSFRLINVEDNKLFFNANASFDSGYWLYNNEDINITDSGNWYLLASCTNDQGQKNINSVTWLVPFGYLEPYLIYPTGDFNVSKNEFFNFSSGVRCVGGECGNITAILDPQNTCSETFGFDCGTGPPEYDGDNTFDDCSVGYGWDESVEEIYVNNSMARYDEEVRVDCYVTNYAYPDYYPSDRLKISYRNSSDGGWTEKLFVDTVDPKENYTVIFTPDNVLGEHQVRCSFNYGNIPGSCAEYSPWWTFDNDDVNFSVIRINKGIVPMYNGTPFYTINQNPVICPEMKDSDSCNQTWQINATGMHLSNWDIFTIYKAGEYGKFIEKRETDKLIATIIGNYPPHISNLECQLNNTQWINCSNIKYNDHLTKVKGNCSDKEGTVTNVYIKLLNTDQNLTYFDSEANLNGKGWVYNTDLIMNKSGYHNLLISCSDDQSNNNNFSLNWLINWGILNISLPLNDSINVNKNEFFNFSSNLSCIIGECGDISATLMPRKRILFYETFPNRSINYSNWNKTGCWVSINTVGNNEPSEPYSLNLNGCWYGKYDRLTSQTIDLSSYDNITASFAYERGGGRSIPGAYDYLYFEIFNSSQLWETIWFINGSNIRENNYTFVNFTLPAQAYHSMFRFRFRSKGSYSKRRDIEYDDFFVDDIVLFETDGKIKLYNTTPFYSINKNPYNSSNLECFKDMVPASSCSQLWQINATGPHLSKWNFYVAYTPSTFLEYINEKHSQIVNVTIIGDYFPEINNIECEENNSVWKNCSEIAYKDNLTAVRVNCTDKDSNITNVHFVLENIQDSEIFFNSSFTFNQDDLWYYDFDDIEILDSGTFNLSVSCTDNQNLTTKGSSVWNVDWGKIVYYFYTPPENISIKQNKNFNYSAYIKCVGGECGAIRLELGIINYTILQPYEPEAIDTYVPTTSSEENSTYLYLATSYDDFTGKLSISTPLLRFNLSHLSREIHEILNSTLYLYSYNHGYWDSINVVVNSINESWNESTTSRPDYDLTVIDSIDALYLGWYNWQITSLVYKWNEELIPNNGLLLKSDYGGFPSSNGRFASSNYSNHSRSPKLEIRYSRIIENNGTPFYTINQNPVNCSYMQGGDSCNQTWLINATGPHLSEWELNAIYVPVDYYGYVTQEFLNSTNVTIIGNYHPEINKIECQENNSLWVNCSDILYNDNLTKIRISCSDKDGVVTNVGVKLENIPDNNTFFDNIAVQDGDYWIYDNDDILIEDSGNWQLSVNCTDNGGIDMVKYSNKTVQWIVPWGILDPYLMEPLENINISLNEIFNFSSGVRCIGGECGDINVTLNPLIILGPFNVSCSSLGCIATNNHSLPYIMSDVTLNILNYQGDLDSGTEYFDIIVDGVTYDRVCDDESCTYCNLIIDNRQYIIPKNYTDDRTLIVQFDSSSAVDKCDPYLGVEYQLIYFGKGRVPMHNGTPFFTYQQNPVMCPSMKDKDSCNQTWTVNATGKHGTYKFFTIYTSEYTGVEEKKTDIINVTIINEAPVLYPIDDIIINKTQLITIIANATDPNGDDLTYYINDSRFSQNNNIFTWQTQIGDAGNYSVFVTVSDGELNDSQIVYITVQDIEPPCTIPTDGMNITTDMWFCDTPQNEYNLPNGINIRTDGITLDCNNVTLFSNNQNYGVYFHSVNDVTFKNCHIEKYRYGIYLYYSNNSKLQNIDSTDNYYTGIYVYYSPKTEISNSISNSNNDYGVYLYHSDNNTIKDSEMKSNSDQGIYSSYSDNSKIINNNLSKNYDPGIYLYFSNNNLIEDNYIDSNNYYGIHISSSSYNNLTNNTLYNNNRNIFVSGSNVNYYNHLIDSSNTINNKPVYYYFNVKGITLENIDAGHIEFANSTNIIINNVTVTNADGIKLDYTTNSTIKKCTSNYNNNNHNIYLYYSDGNKIENCIADSGYNGIMLYYSDYNEVLNNTAKNNDGGIYSYYADYNTIVGNNLTNNLYNGIRLYYGSTNNVTNNNASQNSDYGIYVSYSNNNKINNNSVAKNSDGGIYLYYSSFANLNNNDMRDNNRNLYIIASGKNNYNHTISTSNNVNGRPVYYYFDKSDIILENLDAGHVEFAYCNNVSIKNVNVSYADGIKFYQVYNSSIINSISDNNDNNYGINLRYSHNNSIINNSATSQYYHGIYLYYSHYNNVKGNNASYNSDDGIYLYYADYNKLTNNNLELNSDYGINYYYADYNNISYNYISGNRRGLNIYHSKNNSMSFNDIINNKYGAYLYGSSYSPSSGNNFEYNNIYSNPSYDLYNNQIYNISAVNNWWGTTNKTIIMQNIYDHNDSSSRGYVFFEPYLLGQIGPPMIISLECEENNSIWGNCSEIKYNDELTKVRVNCTDIMGNILSANLSLINIPDDYVFFDNEASSVNGYWVYDNSDITIEDSGEFRLIAECFDNEGNKGENYYNWVIAWGTLLPYLISPVNSINVTQNEFFNFSSGVKCIKGECGDVNATLDPYGPDGYNYTAFNSTEPEGDAFMWEEIITNSEGTALWDIGQSADNNYKTAPIDFDFSFYGANYTTAHVSSNGRVHFTSTGATYTSIGLPSNSYKVIAPVNKDMYVRSQTQVFYKTYDNPKRFIVEYKDLDHYFPSGNYLTYEVILYEDGRIKIQYNSSSDTYSSLGNIGINYASSNNYYLFIEYDAPDLHKGEAVTFYPPEYEGYQEGKGIVPMNNGSPFYTIDQNPTTCPNMKADDVCEKTWRVNATGNNNTWEFYTIYESVTANIKNKTKKVNITIVGPKHKKVNVSLVKGWNLISIPLNLTEKHVNSIFTNISIYSYKNNSWFVPDEIDNKLGYWVKVNESVNVTVVGTEMRDNGIELNEGWNLIGYPSLNETNISERFDNVTVYMYNNSNWYSYIAGRNLNSLNKFIPGYGYWVKVK